MPDLPLQVAGIAMAEGNDGTAGQPGRLANREMRRLVDQHGVETSRKTLHEDIAADVAGDEIECFLRIEELGSLSFDGECRRVGAKAGSAGGRMDAVAARGLTGSLNHLGAACQPQVTRSAEVQVALPVDESLCTWRALHDLPGCAIVHGICPAA